MPGICHRPARVTLLGLLFLAPLLRAEVQLPGRDAAAVLASARAHAAERFGLPIDDPATRLAAVAILNKAEATEDGSGRVLSDKWHGRVNEISDQWTGIVEAIRASHLPAEIQDQLIRHHGGRFLFPLRQDPPRFGVTALRERLAAVPAGGTVITIADNQGLAPALTAHWPAFVDCSPVQQYLVYRGLAALNPLLTAIGSYRTTGAAGIERTAVGPLLLDQQMLHLLYAIDPTLRILPPGPDAGRGDELRLPVGQGAVRVTRFHLPGDARIYLPTPAHLAELANPRHCDLRACWISDPALLSGLDPVHLDLRGNDIRDLTGLPAMPALQELRLDDNPITSCEPLGGRPLQWLGLVRTAVSDLTPLQGMPLRRLDLGFCPVTDLTPLRGMTSLASLDLRGCPVADLAPLAALPLTDQQLALRQPYSSLDPVLSHDRLATIGDIPTAIWAHHHRRVHDPAAPDSMLPETEPAKPASTAPAAVPKVEKRKKKTKKKNPKLDNALDDLLEQ